MSRLEAVFLLHALAFLDSYKSHHRCCAAQLHSDCFVFVKPALASQCGKYIQKSNVSVATVKKTKTVNVHKLFSRTAGEFVSYLTVKARTLLAKTKQNKKNTTCNHNNKENKSLNNIQTSCPTMHHFQ